MITNEITERIGVHKVALVFLEELGWLEREQSISDYGIDMQVEMVIDGVPTGQLIALQIKSGLSYFSEKTEVHFVYRGSLKHLEYWENHSLPVFIVLYNPIDNTAYWQQVKRSNIEKTSSGWKTNVPTDNILCKSSHDSLVSIYSNILNYPILKIDDNSIQGAKRVSTSVLIEGEKAKSKHSIRKIVPLLINQMKRSDYHRNEITKSIHRGNDADVVFLFFYENLNQSKYGLTFCRAIWNSPSCKYPLKPFEPDELIKDIEIKWDHNYGLPDAYIANNRMSKGEYLDLVDTIYAKSLEIIQRIKPNIETDKVKESISSIAKVSENLDQINEKFKSRGFPPIECKALDELLSSAVCLLHNILVVANDKKTEPNNMEYLFKMHLKDAEEKFSFFPYERKKVT